MMFGVVKRLLLGQPMRSDRLGHTLLPKRIALPVFASDALSSVAYATEEILIVLSVGGIAFFHYTPYIALAVGVLMLVVVASYRQNVHAYPSGGGDYEVTTTNLGPRVGMAVASALMVDYTLTVAVSVSAGVANLASAFPVLDSHVTLIAVLVVAVIALMNLRGVRESGTAFAIPTYCFIGVVALLIIVRIHPARAGPPSASPTAPATGSRPAGSTPGWPWSSCCCARSPPAAPRSPGWRRSATGCRRSASRRARTPRPRWPCWARSR